MSLPNDPKYECVMGRGPAAAASEATHNTVHRLKEFTDGVGLEIKLNWRYWGIAFSWGDLPASWKWTKNEDKVPATWFIGFHIGPLFFVYAWPKQAVK